MEIIKAHMVLNILLGDIFYFMRMSCLKATYNEFNSLFIFLQSIHPGNRNEIRYLSYFRESRALSIDVRE